MGDSTRVYTSAQPLAPHLPRHRPRHEVRGLVYVTLDNGNGGLLRDISEDGLALHAVASLPQGQKVRVRFELPSPKTRVEADGTIVWTKASGEAGVRFGELTVRNRAQLKEWIFTNLLADAKKANWDILEPTTLVDSIESDQLILSGNARPVIQLKAQESRQEFSVTEPDGIFLDFSWWPVAIPARRFSWSVDMLAIFSAVLLFALVFLPLTFDALPPLTSVAVLLVSIAVFSGLYCLYFAALGTATAGVQLAKIAGDQRRTETSQEREANRFR